MHEIYIIKHLATYVYYVYTLYSFVFNSTASDQHEYYMHAFWIFHASKTQDQLDSCFLILYHFGVKHL